MKKSFVAIAVVPFILSAAFAGERESKVERKLQSTFIPRLEFKNAQFDDVLEYLSAIARERCPDKIGVNMINLAQNLKAVPAEKVAAPQGFNDFFDKEGAFKEPQANPNDIPRVTINVRNMSLKEALDFITQMTGLKYHIKKDVVVISKIGDIRDKETRIYRINDPAALNRALQGMQQQGQPQQQANHFDPFQR